ncbi:hypothetical protein AVEN_32748-1 [Araneus ventricosus]|uniref:Uncharacterized protein n=1 Tax=Araneus ventricosus TaxID=182803 RepID=A0A4Y2CUP4_ARAVE|nr:hypothetical protein AVEN_32748-1 [Araneus ventricosus]
MLPGQRSHLNRLNEKRDGHIIRSWLWLQVRNSIPHIKSAVYVGLVDAQSDVETQTPSRWCNIEIREGADASRAVLLSGHGSKLRNPSQNSLCVASERDNLYI